MKFYVAEAPDGRTVLSGTQAEAKKINKEFIDFDVPVDKPGLMAFAQDALDQIHTLKGIINGLQAEDATAPEPGETTEVPWNEDPTPTPVPTADYVPSRFTAGQIEDFLLEHATTAQVEQIFTCLGHRFSTLVKQTTLETAAE